MTSPRPRVTSERREMQIVADPVAATVHTRWIWYKNGRVRNLICRGCGARTLAKTRFSRADNIHRKKYIYISADKPEKSAYYFQRNIINQIISPP